MPCGRCMRAFPRHPHGSAGKKSHARRPTRHDALMPLSYYGVLSGRAIESRREDGAATPHFQIRMTHHPVTAQAVGPRFWLASAHPRVTDWFVRQPRREGRVADRDPLVGRAHLSPVLVLVLVQTITLGQTAPGVQRSSRPARLLVVSSGRPTGRQGDARFRPGPPTPRTDSVGRQSAARSSPRAPDMPHKQHSTRGSSSMRCLVSCSRAGRDRVIGRASAARLASRQ